MIKVEDIRKSYGELRAVDGISFDVGEQEILGFLGPNGAGKTTTLEMIEGLRRPDSGKVFIKDIPVWPNPHKIRDHIGVQLQATSFYENLTVKETIILFGSLYGKKISNKDCTHLLERMGLEEKGNSYASTLSGGQMQRLAIVTTLVNEPEIIFLDEPTTGLDPQARRKIWEIVKELQKEGKTVVLSTHYMEEAEFLCDRVAVIDQGKIVALDSPLNLIAQLQSDSKLSFRADKPLEKEAFEKRDIGNLRESSEEGSQVVYTSDPGKSVVELMSYAQSADIHIKDLHITTPTLEDVFISLTGKELRD